MRLSVKNVGQMAFILFLAYVTVVIMRGNEPYILHSIDLIFHEAGHVIFGFFGDFVHFLGGTLMQLLVPVVLGAYFSFRKEWYAACAMLWWFGANLVDVGIYIADAQAQVLPLLGGEHDWYYLLNVMNVIEHDTKIGAAVSMLGKTAMWTALALMLSFVLNEMRRDPQRAE